MGREATGTAAPRKRTGGHNALAARMDRVSDGSAAARPYARPVGLYDPAYEHDGCGVACLARLDGVPAHETIARAIDTLDNLEHRGAEGADAETGDGAGILTQIPDAFLRAEVEFALPAAGGTRSRSACSRARPTGARRPRP